MVLLPVARQRLPVVRGEGFIAVGEVVGRGHTPIDVVVQFIADEVVAAEVGAPLRVVSPAVREIPGHPVASPPSPVRA